MQLTPRYEGRPVISMTGDASTIRAPFLRQRRRLVETLAELDDEQWGAQSRCDDWTAQGVVTHLLSTDPFWTASLRSGLAGEPTQILRGFDPKATPAALVDASDEMTPGETLAAFRAATTELSELVESLTVADFDAVAEAPPGHVTVGAMLHHALWDCWVHERDILVPLGTAPAPDPEEVIHCLRYGAALTAAFAVLYGSSSSGALTIDVHDPGATFHVAIDDAVTVVDGPAPTGSPVLSGPALDVLEGLSVRRPLEHDLGEDEWMLSGLRTVFDAS